jgi:hypothetical protein
MFLGLPLHTGLVVGGSTLVVLVLLILWGLRFREDA